MILDPAAMLDGPRGRRLCLEILLDAARRGDSPESRDAVHQAFWAAHALGSGSAVVFSIGDAEPFAEPDVTPEAAAEALSRVPVPEITPEVLSDALEMSVDAARYWQPPDGADVLAAATALRPALAAVAVAVARSAHVSRWAGTADRGDQWAVHFDGADVPAAHPRSVLPRWRAHAARSELERAADDPGTRWSGTWWSTPPRALPLTTGPGESGEPRRLRHGEDGLGWTSARAGRVSVPEGPVIEIAGPSDWAALCLRHPLVVTASRRGDWEHVAEHRGVWIQPDWASVAEESVGVHVSVAAYLVTAGRAIPVGELGSSVLAGWSPDETYWFDPVTPQGPDARWERDEAPGPWHPA